MNSSANEKIYHMNIKIALAGGVGKACLGTTRESNAICVTYHCNLTFKVTITSEPGSLFLSLLARSFGNSTHFDGRTS